MSRAKQIKAASRSLSQNGVLLFMVCHNERLRLPFFLDYYRELGVERFFIVSHISTDGTSEYLKTQPDVQLYEVEGSFWDSDCGQVWLRPLLEEHGENRWCLLVDADELLKYPNCETKLLPDLTRELDNRNYTAMYSVQLDLYSKGPIREAVYRAGQDPLEVCSHFDPASHYIYEDCRLERLGTEYNVIVGGVRGRIFQIEPFLNKVPLIKFSRAVDVKRGTHFVRNVRFSPMQGCILHVKYIASFPTLVGETIKADDRGFHLSEYEAFLVKLKANPNLSFYYEKSVGFHNSEQLCELGLMRPLGARALRMPVCRKPNLHEGWHCLYGKALHRWRFLGRLRRLARRVSDVLRKTNQPVQIPGNVTSLNVGEPVPELRRKESKG